jgi:hypothetical protein
MGSIMNSKIIAGASTLVIVAVLATAGPASAQYGRCGGCYLDYAYRPAYAYAPAPLYSYYGAYDSIPWNYRGGPHPR